MKIYSAAVFTVIFLSILPSCQKLLPEEIEENEVLDGTVEGLTLQEQILFGEGDEAFARAFTVEEGLGPIFVETSCLSCHIGDGRGHPFTELVRFAYVDSDGNADPLLQFGGPQLQHRSIPGFEPENIPEEANGITSFLAPPNTGLGFLEAVADEDILALADPYDVNGDGISGVPSYIAPLDFYSPYPFNIPNNEGEYICRFGRKAGAIDLLIQTVGAYRQDMGITSAFLTHEPQGVQLSPEEPEVTRKEVLDVVFYLQTLKAPQRRNETNEDVIAGEAIFKEINCSGCHTPELKTTTYHIEAISNKTFYPYTDLLLHDMGPELDDNYTEGSASTAEWRTTPLWGLGLASDVQGGVLFLMHDGRARTYDEAIQYHGGEGSNSREAYNALSGKEKEQLISFLESL